MASRNGLNPKIKGLKGRGFGRALPAPFGWGNGIYPGGIGFLSIPALGRNTQFPNDLAIECWVNTISNYGGNRYLFSILDTLNNQRLFCDSYNGSLQISASSANGYLYTGPNSVPFIPRFHAVINHNLTSINKPGLSTIFMNGVISATGYSNLALPFNINNFLIFSSPSQGGSWQCPIDELRIYRKSLSAEEIRLNYNEGVGNNPSVTEFLTAWYQFESFEMLDFSVLQDGSDIKLGIRDISGNNNHALPNNMDTNPLSANYVLKTF